jgi:hypothetical protein
MLSIDVGIKNLGLCVMLPATKKIRYWNVDGVPPMHADGLFMNMKRHMDERRKEFECVDKVLIERQPEKNKAIKSIEHFLHTYFLCLEKEVIIWDARHKIPDVIGPGKVQYRLRKKASVDRCRAFLLEHNPEWLTFFDESKKKDDLADTVMQALSYHPPKEEKKVQKCRRPTQNQERTKYSRANLAWLFKNNMIDTPRFKKDLLRYYSEMNELITEFNLDQQ